MHMHAFMAGPASAHVLVWYPSHVHTWTAQLLTHLPAAVRTPGRSLRESAPSYQQLMRQLSAIQRLPTCGSQRTSRYLQQLQEAQRGSGGSNGHGVLAASPDQMRQLSCDATPLLDTLACLPDLQSVMAERTTEAMGCKVRARCAGRAAQ